MKNLTTSNSEEKVDQILMHDDHHRRIITDVGDSGWGQLILPSKTERKNKTGEGMKMLVISSYIQGWLLLETLKKIEKQNPSRLNIVGLATDDPASPTAKISKKRRIWRMYDEADIISLETSMIESGLEGGIPVYTGAVKTEYFRKLLKKWNPDVILVCVFGQIIDAPIINFPELGIYNFHPANLLAGHGAGPRPFQDLIDRDAQTSKLTIHQLTVELDAGPIVGQSPPINARFADGGITDNILVFEDKMIQPTDIMATLLTKALVLHKERGMKGNLQKLDFAKHFNDEMKQWLMKPIASKEPSASMPQASGFADYDI